MKNSCTKALEQNFKDLIINQCKFCGFDKYLKENPDFEFPEITPELLGPENGKHIIVPGLLGGFDCFLEEIDNELILYVEQSSRMDYDSNSYMYFKITESGSRIPEGEEREAAQKKFRELTKKSHEKHLQELKARREKAKE